VAERPIVAEERRVSATKARIVLVAPDPSRLGNRPHHIKLAKTLFPPLVCSRCS
jgi:hypothetical protein